MIKHTLSKRRPVSVITLLFLLILFVNSSFGVARAEMMTSVEEYNKFRGPNQSEKTIVEGEFNTFFGDGFPGSSIKRTSHFIHDNVRGLTELVFDEPALKNAGSLSALNHNRVIVVGDQLGERKVKVKDINIKNSGSKIDNTVSIPLDNTGTTNSLNESEPVWGSRPWISILCKFADIPDEPKPISYFQDLFSDTYPGLDHYWQEVSYGNVNLEGSRVVGWYTLPQPRSYYVYDINGDGKENLDYWKAAIDCTAAADADVHFPDFTGINLMFNSRLDCCAWGAEAFWMNLDGAEKTWSMTWEPPFGYIHHQILAHETGHGFGLPHARSGNWDGISTCSPPDAMFNCIANDRIAYHLDRNGWIPPIRKYEATPNSDQIISIERLDLPTTPAGYLMAQIPIDGSAEHFYTVEARKFAGYDNQIPGEGIVIFEVDTNRDTPAHIVDADNDGDENDDGVIWLPGETFTDGIISVFVLYATDTGFVLNISNKPYNLSGFVRKPNGDPVANASVRILNGAYPSVLSNENGYYTLSNIALNTYSIQAYSNNCQTQTQTLFVDTDLSLNFTLSQKTDEFGYACEVVASSYIFGDNLLPLSSDDANLQISLPFPFKFYGNVYNNAFISTNGFLNFISPDNTYHNHSIPNILEPNGAIYPFWDDLIIDNEAGVFTQILGSAPNRKFVIEWRNASFVSDNYKRIGFEIVLYEDGKILTQYIDIDNNEKELGASATIGIEDPSGTIALQYSSDGIAIDNNLAVLYSSPSTELLVPQDYLTINQAMAVAQAGDIIQVAPGTYNESITVKSGISLRGSGSQDAIIDGGGADVVVYISGEASISGFTIRNSSPDWWGAGVWVSDGTPTITMNNITANSMGISFYCFTPCSGQPRIENNIIHNNLADGIYIHDGGSLIVNNTVSDNGHSGIHTDTSETIVKNNSISGNGYAGISASNKQIDSAYNNVWGNSTDYLESIPDPTDLSGDPKFVSPSTGDYHISAMSPNIDTGINVDGLAGDIDGEDRPHDGNGDGTPAMDIGADEYTGTPASPPEAPTDLVATAVSFDQIDLSWTDNASNEDGIELERSPDGSTNWTLIASLGADVTSYSDTGLSSGTTYYYRLHAFNNVGSSSISNVASAATTGSPTAPTSLVATAISESQIELTWIDYSDNEDGFNLERSPDGTAGWMQIASTEPNAASYTDDGLNPGEIYYYKVCAFNEVGSECSDIASASTLQTPASVDYFAVSEEIVAGSVSGGYLDTFDNDDASETITERESGGKPNKRYSFLEHKWMFNVQQGNLITFQANIWASPSNDNDTFILAFSTDDVAYTDMFTVTAASDDGNYQTFELPSSLSGLVYIRVKDTDQTPGNKYLDTLFIDHMFIRGETASGNPPEAPSNLEVASISSSQIELTWTDNSTGESGFEIERSLDSSTWEIAGTVGENMSSFTDSALAPATTYHYRVRAYNAVGHSGYSNVVVATTTESVTLHVGDLHGISNPIRNKWNAIVTVSIHDMSENPVAGATVNGIWSAGASGSGTCVTDGEGKCSISVNNLKSNIPSVTFTVNDVTKTGYEYQPFENHDPLGDSNGTRITIFQ